MNSPRVLREQIAKLEVDLNYAKGSLAAIQRSCNHEWAPVLYKPDHQPGFQTQGDPPGTMGIDWQGPMWIEPKTTKKWERTCRKCELTQVTERTKKVSVQGSIPGTSAEQEVPEFPVGRF